MSKKIFEDVDVKQDLTDEGFQQIFAQIPEASRARVLIVYFMTKLASRIITLLFLAYTAQKIVAF